MADSTTRTDPPAGWLDILAESEAQLAAGQTVPGEKIMRELHDSIARLDAAGRADAPKPGTAPRR